MGIKVSPSEIPDVFTVEMRSFEDARGVFGEVWKASSYAEIGIDLPFVQDNYSRSSKGVLRGLHLQVGEQAQGKLISVLAGALWDVAVDVRLGSPTFGKWVCFELSAADSRQVWIPPGFAHGFVSLSDQTTMFYKCTGEYDPNGELGLRWDDPAFAIDWPKIGPFDLSQKDASAPFLEEIRERLPHWKA